MLQKSLSFALALAKIKPRYEKMPLYPKVTSSLFYARQTAEVNKKNESYSTKKQRNGKHFQNVAIHASYLTDKR